LGQWSKRPTDQGVWRFCTHPLTAWEVHAAALWLWHIPRFFQATLGNDWIHSAQHVSFLGSALLFWWSLFYANGEVSYGASVLYLFTTAVHTSILGALLTFAASGWYPDYAATTPAWGLTLLEDQQLGGLIMWIPAGLVYVIGGLTLFALWLRESGRVANVRSFNRRVNMRLSIFILSLMLAACGTGPTAVSAGGNARAGGHELYRLGCGSCHTIPGIAGAHGKVGPSLESIASHSYIAGQLPNQPPNLERWIQHPHSVHPDSVMPELGVTEAQSRNIAAYLYSLN
jgi:cytochrome c2